MTERVVACLTARRGIFQSVHESFVSGACTGWVLKHGPSDRAMRLVLLVIADAANAKGEHAHPGLTAIMEGSLYSRSTVFAVLDKLQAEGWLRATARHAPGRATTYDVLMDRSSSRTSESGDRSDSRSDPGDPRSNPADDAPTCFLSTVSTTDLSNESSSPSSDEDENPWGFDKRFIDDARAAAREARGRVDLT